MADHLMQDTPSSFNDSAYIRRQPGYWENLQEIPQSYVGELPGRVTTDLYYVPGPVQLSLINRWFRAPNERQDIMQIARTERQRAETTANTATTTVSRTSSSNVSHTVEKLLRDYLKEIPKYAGSRKPNAARDWLLKCEHAFNAIENYYGSLMSDPEKILCAVRKLDGDAEKSWTTQLEVARSDSDQAISTWKRFREWIDTHYGDHQDPHKYWAKLTDLRQNKDPVWTYFSKLVNMANKCHGTVTDETRVNIFINGLNPMLRGL